MAKGKYITSELWTTAKCLCSIRDKNADVAQLLGLSDDTVRLIRSSDSFESYRDMRTSQWDKRKDRNSAGTQLAIEDAAEVTPEGVLHEVSYGELERIAAALERIAAALERIADAITAPD